MEAAPVEVPVAVSLEEATPGVEFQAMEVMEEVPLGLGVDWKEASLAEVYQGWAAASVGEAFAAARGADCLALATEEVPLGLGVDWKEASLAEVYQGWAAASVGGAFAAARGVDCLVPATAGGRPGLEAEAAASVSEATVD
jgi:hypothetical protein